MRAVVLAYHTIGCTGIKALLQNGFEILAVFTHSEDPNENIWFESVAELTASYNIPTFAPENINHPMWIEKINNLKPDIIFSFYYRNLVGRDILNIPPNGCLNLHGSLLPKYRGRSPINWVLINGEKETGVTLHYMTPKPDDGDIVCQKQIEISEDDTAKTLFEKANVAAGGMLDEILPKLKADTVPRTSQDHSQASYFGGRTPQDGEIDWTESAHRIRNLVRAVTRPYPGAFSFLGHQKCYFWQVTERPGSAAYQKAGTVMTTTPLVIACGQGALEVDFAQRQSGIYTHGTQLAKELSLQERMSFGPHPDRIMQGLKKQSILILGVNGFIGNALTERLLDSRAYEVHGMDLHCNYIRPYLEQPRFHFHEGDISINREWVEYHIKKCDIVIPLVAIATPIEYVRNPLGVFELDFEENLRVIRYCVKYKKRVIFPSTSEVYGMCRDDTFDEYASNLVLGPIHKQRWIYACCKQLLDRVIWAYGQKEGLKFTLFRPFNWIGPKLDTLLSARIGSSRAITQLILNLTQSTPIQLVDGGRQKRCFTDVGDGVECLYRIIENRDGVCDGKIINIGSPQNEVSIKKLAEMLVAAFQKHPLRDKFPPFAGFVQTDSRSFYGKGYQDVKYRKPDIRAARKLLGWSPKVDLQQSVKRTLDFFLRESVNSQRSDAVKSGRQKSEAGLP
jgi:UDP-4-amino-4-deoxy-L-arabinose formyltransferase/UDP-glucuronic acid dehydrogenase (UDP-4-keto-hexauronic acid decarboxylating)